MLLRVSPGALNTAVINAVLRIGKPFLLTNNKAPFAIAFPAIFTGTGELHPDSVQEIIKHLKTFAEETKE